MAASETYSLDAETYYTNLLRTALWEVGEWGTHGREDSG